MAAILTPINQPTEFHLRSGKANYAKMLF